MYEHIIKKLEESDKIAIFMHINPDGDCIGASLALFAFLKKLNKKVYIFTEDKIKPISDRLKFLPMLDVLNCNEAKSYDLSIAVDCGDANRLGNECFKMFLRGHDNMCIDHHEVSAPFCKTTVLEPKSASTTQILYKILAEYDKKLIDTQIATFLYVGLLTDSGGFTYKSTTKETHTIAGKLLELGVDGDFLARKLFKETAMGVFKLKNRVLSNAKFYLENRLGIIVFEDDDFTATGTDISHTEGIVNSILDIKDVKLAVSLSKIGENAFKAGLRSKDNFNAGSVAQIFGGGGHRNASGCRLYGDISDIIAKLISITTDMLN